MEQSPTTTDKKKTTKVAHVVDSNYTKHDIKLAHDKKRKGLIIGIVVAVLVVLLGVVAAWFCLWYSNPNQVAYDAASNLFKAENVGIEGGFTIDIPDEDSAIEMVLISFDTASNHLPGHSTLKVQFIFDPEKVEGEPRVLVSLSDIVMRDGVIYLQIAGLMDSINSLELDEDTRSEIAVFLNAIELIDNEWWQISIPDILQTLEVPEEQQDVINEFYQCGLQAFNHGMSEELAAIYKQNQFVEVKESKWLAPDTESAASAVEPGHKAYELIIDKSKLADFVNQLPETSTSTELIACYNNVAKKYGGEKVRVSDIPMIDEDDVEWPDSDEVRIFLEISKWDHKLRSAHVFFYDDEELVASGALKFKYDAVTINPPESYRPITELFDELLEDLGELIVWPIEAYEEL